MTTTGFLLILAGLLAGLLILIANLAVLGINFKLYTEYFKDRSMDKRYLGKADKPKGEAE